MITPNYIRVAGNDEHGAQTAGKRTPVMPYIDRPFLENEFNRPTKYKFLMACARNGFTPFDVHPLTSDTPIPERVSATNAASPAAAVTFAYNATVDPGWNDVSGTMSYFSSRSPSLRASQRLAVLISTSMGNLNALPNLGYGDLDIGMLSSVVAPSALAEAGFMTNFSDAKLMLDPEWQTMIAEACALAVCRFFDVTYTPPTSGGDYPDLSVGASGSYVYLLQSRLNLEESNLGIDGSYGGLTQRAVMRFQQANDLPPSGSVDRETWRRLLTDYSVAPTLQTGSAGVYVRYLQQKLLSKLYPIGTADGVYGALTASSVSQFQSENGLPVTGVADATTWREATVFDQGRPFPS